ncbi:hypothetical protein ACFV6Y_39045 [Streptomyces massasporeus]|uniref:hypothetical protein n=1 Tax=Streptomyces massasporeus TaxID=67324 RepID=UPI003653AB98
MKVIPHNRKALLTTLRLERRAIEAERSDLVYTIRGAQMRIDQLDERRRDIDASEGYLTSE